jgi:glutathione S-transferase
VDAPGRPLAAANAALPVPAETHLAAWQSLTTLREHRGDGHNAALLQRGISGVGAHVLAAAAGRTSREWLLRARGWDDAAWDAAAGELASRGWLDGGELTAEGAPSSPRSRPTPTGWRWPPGRRWATRGATGWPNC